MLTELVDLKEVLQKVLSGRLQNYVVKVGSKMNVEIITFFFFFFFFFDINDD